MATTRLLWVPQEYYFKENCITFPRYVTIHDFRTIRKVELVPLLQPHKFMC